MFMLQVISAIHNLYTLKEKARKRALSIDLQQEIDDLLNQVSKPEFEGKDVALIYQILHSLSIVAAASSECRVEEHAEAGEWEPHYNKSIYQAILPLCRLAHLHEKNGIAEEHALKLALIFKSSPAVLDYLLDFKKMNQFRHLVHDACLFDLPSPLTCHWNHWQDLANIKNRMLNPRFRELLPHAAAIEKQSAGDTPNRMNRKSCKTKELALDAITKKYNTLAKKPQFNRTEQQRQERQEKLAVLSQTRSQLRLELAELSQGLPIQEASITVLQSFLEAYKQGNSNKTHQILIKHGITDKNIALLDTLKPPTEQFIPFIHLDGLDIGYPGFYLTKLDTRSPEGAALAACLGKITACCQYLGGIAHSCVVHGIESAYSGFYVLFKGDAKKPSLSDPVVSQAWAWLGDKEQLCLDSIEVSPRFTNQDQMISDLYRYFGFILTTDKQYNISQVNTGDNNFVTSISLNNYPAPLMRPRDYAHSAYRDSASQLILATADLPYAFYNTNHSQELNAKIEHKTRAFFQRIFSVHRPLREYPELSTAIGFYVFSENEALEELLFSLIDKKQHEELRHFIKIHHGYIRNLDNLNDLQNTLKIKQASMRDSDCNLIPFDYFNKGLSPNTLTKDGESALHCAARLNSIPLVKKLLETGINPDIQDIKGDTALLMLLKSRRYQKDSLAVRSVAYLLIKKMPGASLDIKNIEEKTPLIMAVIRNDLDMVKKLVKYGANVDIYDDAMKTAIYWAVSENREVIFNFLLTQNPVLNLVELDSGNTLVMEAAQSPNPSFIKALSAYPELIDLDSQNKEGQSLLDFLCNKKTTFNATFGDKSTKELRSIFRKYIDTKNWLWQSFIRNNWHLFFTLLSLFSDSEQKKILAVGDNFDPSLLYIAVRMQDLELIDKLLEAGLDIEKSDCTNTTAICKAARLGHAKAFHHLLEKKANLFIISPYYESLVTCAFEGGNESIINTMMGDCPLVDFDAKNPGKYRMIDLIYPDSKFLQGIIKTRPLQEMNDLLKARRDDLAPVILDAFTKSYPKYFIMLLKAIPARERITWLRFRDSHGHSSLQRLGIHHNHQQKPIEKYWLLRALEDFNDAQLNELFMTTKTEQPIIFLRRYFSCELNLAILKRIPACLRMNSVFSNDENSIFSVGTRPLTRFDQKTIAFLKEVLTLLSVDERFTILTVHDLVKPPGFNIDFFKMILSITPPARYQEAIALIDQQYLNENPDIQKIIHKTVCPCNNLFLDLSGSAAITFATLTFSFISVAMLNICNTEVHSTAEILFLSALMTLALLYLNKTIHQEKAHHDFLQGRYSFFGQTPNNISIEHTERAAAGNSFD